MEKLENHLRKHNKRCLFKASQNGAADNDGDDNDPDDDSPSGAVLRAPARPEAVERGEEGGVSVEPEAERGKRYSKCGGRVCFSRLGVRPLTRLLSGDTGDYFLRGAPGSTQRCSDHTDGIRKLRINSVFTKCLGVPHIQSSLSFSFRV